FILVILLGIRVSAAEKAQSCQLSPVFSNLLETLEINGNPLDNLSKDNVADVWQNREVLARKIIRSVPIEKLKDLIIPLRNHQIPIRIYYPLVENSFPSVKKPILVFYHGGGWSLGSIGSYDSVARFLSHHIGAIVVSVDYRLAPEYPFPSGLNDAYMALEWVVRNATAIGGHPENIGVAGDSGGGNLATVVARRARMAGISLALQALFYPSTDIAHTHFTSYAQFGEGYFLTRKAIEIFRSFYLPHEKDWMSPDASPLQAPQSELAQLPQSIVMVAGCDPLKEEGILYAKKLQQSGVSVELIAEPAMIHGFLNFYNSKPFENISTFVEPSFKKLAAKIRSDFLTHLSRHSSKFKLSKQNHTDQIGN
ncbi:MAG: alpha/beta hydrolase, partial [Bdellovibrionales bacterium]|nr:alpha/beta hydrolase [Bdellovibrionales bacterium]